MYHPQVLKNKLPAKDALLNGLAFPQTHRTILHVAVMCGFAKTAKELVNRGVCARLCFCVSVCMHACEMYASEHICTYMYDV